MAGLVCHMHYTEPANYVLVSMLESGYLGEICKDVDKDSPRVLTQLISVLAHLFSRERLPSYVRRQDYKDTPSVVLLDALPEKAQTLVRQHNDRVLAIFTDYVRSYTRLELRAKIASGVCALPLSGLKFSESQTALPLTQPPSIANALKKDAESVEVRSPFVALSGNVDSFKSAHELVNTVHSDIYLEDTQLPLCENLNARATPMKLSAYALDFFKHGQYQLLLRDNKLRDGYTWELLHEWHLNLKMMLAVFKRLSPLSALPTAKKVEHRKEARPSLATGKYSRAHPMPPPKQQQPAPYQFPQRQQQQQQDDDSTERDQGPDRSIVTAFQMLSDKFTEVFKEIGK